MNDQAALLERKKVQSIARKYRREGYRVQVPRKATALPRFLEGLTPDLIAEKDGDRVVVEVKWNHEIRGSNALIDLADRVAKEPGWRLELVAMRDLAAAPRVPAAKLDDVFAAVETLSSGPPVHRLAAYGLAVVTVETLVRLVASPSFLEPEKVSIRAMISALAFDGTIPPHSAALLEQVQTQGNVLTIAAGDGPAAAIPPLLDIARALAAELPAPVEA